MSALPPKAVPSRVAADRLGVSQPHIALLCRQGALEGTKLGRDWFIAEASLKARLQQLAGQPRKGHPGGAKKAPK